MMTFRPYADHEKSARVLDYRRLGKQRVEAMQIMSAMTSYLTGEAGGWTNHPVVRMWAGKPNDYIDHSCDQLHYFDLINYYDAMAAEWRRRGFNHGMDYKVLPFRTISDYWPHSTTNHPLPWRPEDELRHKHILLRKDPEYYGRFWRVRHH